jgi:hypothetical protein
MRKRALKENETKRQETKVVETKDADTHSDDSSTSRGFLATIFLNAVNSTSAMCFMIPLHDSFNLDSGATLKV